VRILLSAFACEPDRGSEEGLGWGWAEALSRKHEVVVLTDARHRVRLDARLQARKDLSLEPVYVGAGVRSYGTLRIHLYYNLWQVQALRVARTLTRRRRFDVVHAVTYAQHRVPSYLWKLGVPFIWGPLGGGEEAPLSLCHPRWMGYSGTAREVVRWLSNRASRIDMRVRRAARSAAALAVTTRETLWALPTDVWERAVLLPAVVFNHEELVGLAARAARPGPPTGLSVAYVGRLVGWKGLGLAVWAFARYAERHPTAAFHVYGEGPDRPRFERLVARLELDGRVVFHGLVPREQVLAELQNHHVFLYPSLHDATGYAPLEAQAAGLPVVCLDAGGPGLYVHKDAGFKIAPRNGQQVIEGFADALGRLTADVHLWRRASEAGRAHALDAAAIPRIEDMIARLYGLAGFAM
jgi:glycosyltransferase involved in cell wall biosynthesis